MDWLRESPWLLWIGAALAFGVVEMTTLDLLFLMLALGALVAAVVAGAGLGIIGQILVFLAASALLVLALRPIALRHLNARGADSTIGIGGNIGRPATVVEEVTDRAGLIKLRGEQWTARAELEGQTFGTGEIVTVVRIDGATAVVGAATPEDKPFEG
jgi:membrane protein implicated in regulation of membrane protease activity